MSRTYNRRTCCVCGMNISTAGAAYYNHMMKHVREGKVRKVTSTVGKFCTYANQWSFVKVNCMGGHGH
jgi:hypothetical protein